MSEDEGVDLYVVMVNDRHKDPEPYVFSTEDAAVDFARETARGWLVEHLGGHDGWLFYAQHPTEDDSIWVLRKVADDPEWRP